MDDPRNGGIGGVDGGGISGIEVDRDMFGRPVAEIDGQGVLGNFGQALTDRKRLTERKFETSFSFSKSSMSSATNLIDPLIHNIHSVHELHQENAEIACHEKSIDEIRAQMPLIQVVSEEKFCVGKSRSTRQRRDDDDDDDDENGISVVSARITNDDDNDKNGTI